MTKEARDHALHTDCAAEQKADVSLGLVKAHPSSLTVSMQAIPRRPETVGRAHARGSVHSWCVPVRDATIQLFPDHFLLMARAWK